MQYPFNPNKECLDKYSAVAHRYNSSCGGGRVLLPGRKVLADTIRRSSLDNAGYAGSRPHSGASTELSSMDELVEGAGLGNPREGHCDQTDRAFPS